MAKQKFDLKLPKKLGGMKLPKGLRKGVNAFVNSPAGQSVIADSLMVAGAALVAATQVQPGSPGRKAVKTSKRALTDIGGRAADLREDMGASASALPEAVRAAAAAFAATLSDARGAGVEPGPKAFDTLEEEGRPFVAKPPRSRRSPAASQPPTH